MGSRIFQPDVAASVPQLEQAELNGRVAERRRPRERLEPGAGGGIVSLKDLDERERKLAGGRCARPALRQAARVGKLTAAERHPHLLHQRIGGRPLATGLRVNRDDGGNEGDREHGTAQTYSD